MDYKIIFLFVLILVIGCTCKENQAETPIFPSDQGNQTEVKGTQANDDKNQIAKIQKPVPIKGKRVTYESCAVYAGATDYAFSSSDGETIMVRVSNYPNPKEGPQAIIPDNMLESGEDLEGIPGANPELVGKGFILVYDELNEKVLKVLIDNE